MKILILFIFAMMFAITPVFAEKVIFSEGIEYEMGIILDESYKSLTKFTKIQGLTTTGEMFFTFARGDFEYSMLLDRTGNWQKAELRDKIAEPEPIEIIEEEKIELHYLISQYERVHNKDQYKFFIKTFDKSLYSGTSMQQFQGLVEGAKVYAIISDPNGLPRVEVEGIAKHGVFEGVVLVPENLWQRGWYNVDIVIEFQDEFYYEKLAFYVFGSPADDSSGCSQGKIRVNGVCV